MVGEIRFRVDRRQGTHRVHPRPLRQVAALDHLLQIRVHVAELEVADDVDSQRDVARPRGTQELAAPAGSPGAARFIERRAALLGPLLDRLQELEPFRRPPLLRRGQSDQPRS